MALILNIETSTTNCSVGLSKDGELISIREQNEGYTHAENITVFISEVLAASPFSLKDLDAVAVSKGPGSYTGLRIGVSATKGLAYALNIPLISVNTLQAMTVQVIGDADPDMLFRPMIDARRMEVYTALFDRSLNMIDPVKALIISEETFADALSSFRIAFFGDGSAKCRSVISHDNAFFLNDIFPSARGMVKLSEKAFQEQMFEDAAYFEPFYLKDFLPGKGSV